MLYKLQCANLHKLPKCRKKVLYLGHKVSREGGANSFASLKQQLTSALILVFPDSFILDTDASQDGIGTILSQIHDGAERVVVYASRSITKAERKYCVTRKELLAVVSFTKLFRPYLLG